MNILLLLLYFLSLEVYANSNVSIEEETFKNKKFFLYSPEMLNPKTFNLSFSYLIEKKIFKKYKFNAFAGIFIAQEEDKFQEGLKAGALGFKGGVIIPTQKWLPIYLITNLGYAKTTLQQNPWFGTREQSTFIKDMFLLEGGFLIKWNNILLTYKTQINNIKYFKNHNFISLGASF